MQERLQQVPEAAAMLSQPAVSDEAIQHGLAAFLRRYLGAGSDVEQFGRMSAGFSWITYRFTMRATVGPRDLILRVAPPDGLFSPYSVLPQVHALQAFAASEVPVPGLVAFSQQGEDIGLPFFISEHVRGDVPMPWAGSGISDSHRRDIAVQFVKILGRLHAFEWISTPLDPAGEARTDRGEVAAIAGWRSSLGRSMTRYYPLLDWGGRWLEKHCPTPPRRTVVHGDYRIGNFLEDKGKITAILDWELVHLGDPHEDLAWALMPTFNGRSRKLYGILEREEVFDLYRQASGIEVSAKSFAFYEAYALYQAAAIQMCAVRAFEVDRSNDMRLAVMAAQMPSIVRALDRALEAIA